MSFAEYPIRIQTFVTAFNDAIAESIEHPDHFIYLFFCTDGYYVIDNTNIHVASNDKLRYTFRNGQKTL